MSIIKDFKKAKNDWREWWQRKKVDSGYFKDPIELDNDHDDYLERLGVMKTHDSLGGHNAREWNFGDVDLSRRIPRLARVGRSIDGTIEHLSDLQRYGDIMGFNFNIHHDILEIEDRGYIHRVGGTNGTYVTFDVRIDRETTVNFDTMLSGREVVAIRNVEFHRQQF